MIFLKRLTRRFYDTFLLEMSRIVYGASDTPTVAENHLLEDLSR